MTDLIFDIPKLIATLSAGITLYPGDVIATGTPVGVGIGGRFLKKKVALALYLWAQDATYLIASVGLPAMALLCVVGAPAVV